MTFLAHVLYGATSRLPLPFIGMQAGDVESIAWLHASYALGRTVTSVLASWHVGRPVAFICFGASLAAAAYAAIAAGVKISGAVCFVLGFSEINAPLDSLFSNSDLRWHFIAMEAGSAIVIGMSGPLLSAVGCRGVGLLGASFAISLAMQVRTLPAPVPAQKLPREELQMKRSHLHVYLAMMCSSAVISTLFVMVPQLYLEEWNLTHQQFSFDYATGVLLGIALNFTGPHPALVLVLALGAVAMLPLSRSVIIVLFGLNPPVHSAVHNTLKQAGYDQTVLGKAYTARRLSNIAFLGCAALIHLSFGSRAPFLFAAGVTMTWAAFLRMSSR